MTPEVQQENIEVIKDPNVTDIKFDTGFNRGEQTITSITVRKPKTGALLGLSIVDILNLNVDTIAKLAPRITQPVMSANDVYELEPSDTTKLCKAVVSFFVKSEEEDFL